MSQRIKMSNHSASGPARHAAKLPAHLSEFLKFYDLIVHAKCNHYDVYQNKGRHTIYQFHMHCQTKSKKTEGGT